MGRLSETSSGFHRPKGSLTIRLTSNLINCDDAFTSVQALKGNKLCLFILTRKLLDVSSILFSRSITKRKQLKGVMIVPIFLKRKKNIEALAITITLFFFTLSIF